MSFSEFDQGFNRSIYHAKICALNLSDAESKAHAQAYFEAAALHSHTAYLALLNRLAASYKLTTDVDGAQSLLRAIESQGDSSGELVELSDLENTSDSWLADLVSTFKTASNPFAVKAARKHRVDVIGSAPAMSYSERAQQWQVALKELAERHRATADEY